MASEASEPREGFERGGAAEIARSSETDRSFRSVWFDRRGVIVGGRAVALHAGSVHYWRLDPGRWRRVLLEVRAMGATLVDTYVPWGVHENPDGTVEFGATDERRDVVRFLRIAEELGLFAIVRPGPHVNAELTYFGIPERVIWNPECQARSPRQNPVMLPSPPLAFPVPSYGSEAFLREVDGWFAAVGSVLGPLVYPNGPIVLVQVDNEGSFFFRDGAYDQDYRPEVLLRYREFLRHRYRTAGALREAHRNDDLTFEAVDPPTRLDAITAGDLTRHLDWVEFQEELISGALSWMASSLSRHGLSGVPTIHNFPLGHEAMPLSIDKVSRAVDIIGLDFYYRASRKSALGIARRTTEIVAFAEGTNAPAFACEMGAGFPPFFPPLDETDNLFTAMTALAFGLRGLNLYMAAGRDRWVGAPIDEQGERQSSFLAWRALFEALSRIGFHELGRRVPVRVVVPVSERRLWRVLHAFGPVTIGAFVSFGGSTVDGAFEDGWEDEGPPVLANAAFLEALESALVRRGVPFAWVAGDVADRSLEGASWIVCPGGRSLDPALAGALRRAADRGAEVSLEPCPAAGDGTFLIDDWVDERLARLGLPSWPVDPADVLVTVHDDESGTPRVLFVINPRVEAARVRIGWLGAARLIDLLGPAASAVTPEAAGSSFFPVSVTTDGSLEFVVPARTVRMLAVEPA